MSKFIKCCLCGVDIEPNDANMCLQCIGSQVMHKSVWRVLTLSGNRAVGKKSVVRVLTLSGNRFTCNA